ncbi:DNA-binding protein [Roseibium algae]|uniref:DNA-binding protein n=1 Tax=Roseibium algae TaxID=3123038 RepID=A0ABU8TLL0_9HYPH
MSHIQRLRPAFKLAVSRSTAAEMCDISPSTFDKWVELGWMSRGYKIGGLRRWDPEKIRGCLHTLKETALAIEHANTENPFDHAVG